MFARFSLTIGGEEIDPHNAKAAELLAFLACERGPVSKARAAETLWPDAKGKQSRDSLYHVLRHLRSIEGGAALVSEQRGAVSLGSNVQTDAVEFIALYNSGEPEDWRAAVELYKGIVLIDSRCGWAIDYEGYYDAMYYDLLSRLERHFDSVGNRVVARYYKDKLTE